MSHRRRRLLAAAALTALAALPSFPAPAAAGEYEINACKAPGDPESTSMGPWAAFSYGHAAYEMAAFACSATTGFGRTNAGWNWVDYPRDNGAATMIARVPAAKTDVISIRRLKVKGHIRQGADGLTTFIGNGPVLCSGGQSACADTWTFDVPRSADDVLTLNVNCWGPAWCRSTPGSYRADWEWAVITAHEDVAPEPAIEGGSVLSAGPQKGTRTLRYRAVDGESGVARVRAILDGVPVGEANWSSDRAVCDHHDWNACPTVRGGELAVDTGRVGDGAHTLSLTVWDAAGNERTVDAARTIEVDNHPDPAPPDDGSSSVPATPATPGRDGAAGATGAAGASGAAGAAGATGAAQPNLGPVNGDGGSPRAVLTASFAKGQTKRSVSYGRSLKVSGRLVDERGRPIRNAIVDVAETKALRGARAASGRPAVTDADGRFTYSASSKQGTRDLVFAYRYRREGPVVAQRRLRMTVRAGVKLSVKLRGAVARYSGRVRAGSMPRGGKLVIVQGRSQGSPWQTFASRRANRKGAFKGAYRLKVRRPGVRLQFRVRVVTEAGWNYGAATSKAVTRRVR